MKKYLIIAFVAVFAAIAGYGVYASQKTGAMSALMLANVEAMAHYEGSSCPNNCAINGDGCVCYGVFYPAWKELS